MENESETASAQEILRECAEFSANGVELANCLVREAKGRPLVRSSLEGTADDIRRIVGARNTRVLPGNRAGEAMQGVPGSSIIDVKKAVHPGSSEGDIVDKTALEDTVRHEEEHERQAQQRNAESVEVGDGQILTWEDVSEVGAMFMQRTIEQVSLGYRDRYDRVTRHVTPVQARDAARSGDLLSLAA